MNIYRITVREISSIEYSVEADSEEEAATLLVWVINELLMNISLIGTSSKSRNTNNET